MRGNLVLVLAEKADSGSIPALAGEPPHFRPFPFHLRVYPRACGGTTVREEPDGDNRGLSPRLRGNPGCPSRRGSLLWSIPALAGEPPMLPGSPNVPPVYPRACGGTANIITIVNETGAPRAVYPRACGGTELTPDDPLPVAGLSPRLRGNPGIYGPSYHPIGSIPALAGEPLSAALAAAVGTVYPRACGGTDYTCYCSPQKNGLSPRLRGNPTKYPTAQVRQRSIPALAGEPAKASQVYGTETVYPRACGGTPSWNEVRNAASGLSPRLRGNLIISHQPSYRMRSIPALAGEP